MKRNVILINERQKEMLSKLIQESTIHDSLVGSIVKELVSNYQPSMQSELNGIDFKNTLKIKSKIDDREFSPEELLTYLKYKFEKLNPDFIKQVIIDWCNDDIGGDFTLSKNISPTLDER